MRKLFSIPLVFFSLASCIGLLLRWHFVSPIAWLKYPYWLHAHSHLMFLGWIFNVLMLAYLYSYDLLSRKRYKALFLLIQLLLVGMLVSFPTQGYGPLSITLSALHTLSVWTFTIWFFNDVKKREERSIWFAKVSFILFTVSSIGILAVGPISANGMGQTKWYYFAVYYYLHFQYNGVFIFGLLSLFLKIMEDRSLLFDHRRVHKAGVILFISLFPTYFLSILWATPGIPFNIVGVIGALLQLLFIFYFIKGVQGIKFDFLSPSKMLIVISISAFILKSILQLLSAHPEIARMASEYRPFVIAYLHLVLVGVVSFFLLGWYIEMKLLPTRGNTSLTLLISGFVASEFTMIVWGIISPDNGSFIPTSFFLLAFSVLMAAGACMITLRAIYSKP